MAKKIPKSGDGTGRTSKGQSYKIGRNASTGRFVPVKDGQKDQKRTTVVTIKKSPKKK